MQRSFMAIVAVTLFSVSTVLAQRTPPVLPMLQETPQPPIIALPAPSMIPADVPLRPLTAEEAAQIALHHQTAVIAAQAQVTAAQGVVMQAKSGENPNLGFSADYNNEAISSTLGPSSVGSLGSSATGFMASANLRQLLYDFNHTRDTVRQAVAQQNSFTANLTRVQSDLVLQVKQAFYAYAQAQHLIVVNDATVKNQQDHLALAQARLNAGVGLPVDVVRAQTSVADAILNLNLARNSASIGQVNLALILGIDPRTPLQVADTNEPAITNNNVSQLVTLALQRRPDILEAQAALQSAQYGISAAKSSNAPALVGVAGYTLHGSGIPPLNNALAVGVAVQWNPFDGGLTKGRVVQAQANTVSAQAQLDAIRLNVVSDVSQAYLNLRTAEQRVVTAQAEVTNAQEGVRLAEGRYRAGIGVFLDVLDAQTALTTAQSNQVNALASVNQARAALAHAVFTNVSGVPASR